MKIGWLKIIGINFGRDTWSRKRLVHLFLCDERKARYQQVIWQSGPIYLPF